MNKNNLISRRGLFKTIAGMSAAGAVTLILPSCATIAKPVVKKSIDRKGNINHSIAYWCFKKLGWNLDLTCQIAKYLGCRSVELLGIEGQENLRMNWDMLKAYDIVDAMHFCHGFEKGLNNPENWPECLKALNDGIDACFEYGFPNIITFTGFQDKILDDVGAKNCVTALKKIMRHAEEKKVNVCLEMLNSRVDVEMIGHPGYQGDSIEYCMEIIRKVGSPRMKLLFDIYHVQVMQGDIITRIREYKDYIGHYHVAGNPGRCELNDKQEINYKPIMKEIVKTGYTGYVGYEFIPTKSAFENLTKAVALCDV